MFLCTFLLVHHTSSPYAPRRDIDTMMFISILQDPDGRRLEEATQMKGRSEESLLHFTKLRKLAP